MRFDGGGSDFFLPFVAISTQKCHAYPFISQPSESQTIALIHAHTNTHGHRQKNNIQRNEKRWREKRKSCEAQSKSCLLSSRHMQHTFFCTHIHTICAKSTAKTHTHTHSGTHTQKHIHTQSERSAPHTPALAKRHFFGRHSVAVV